MAEGSSEETWWGWLQSAKDKVVSQSSEVLEFVKNDIDEFTKVVSEEASSAVSSTASALKIKLNLDDDTSTANHMKKSVSGFLSHVADVFTPPPDDEDEEAFVISNQQPIMLSRLEANIYAKIQQPDVFLNEPSEEEFPSWLEKFDMKDKQVEVADLLVSCKPLHKHFSDLVPNEVSHNVFWQRYFFLEHRLQQQEEKRKQISSRAIDTKADLDKQEMLWEDDEALCSDVDIPEDVQTKLLQQYEDELLAATTAEDTTSTPTTTTTSCSGGDTGEPADGEPADGEPTSDVIVAAPVKENSSSGAARREPNSKQPQSIMKGEQPPSQTASAEAKPEGKLTSAASKPTATQQMRQVATQSARASGKTNSTTARSSTKAKSAVAKVTTPTRTSKAASPPTSSAKDITSDSNEDEWEKVEAAPEDGDSGIVSPGSVDTEEGALLAEGTTAPVEAAVGKGDKPKGEDWETWE